MPFVKHTSEQAAVYKASSRYAHRVGRKLWLPTSPICPDPQPVHPTRRHPCRIRIAPEQLSPRTHTPAGGLRRQLAEMATPRLAKCEATVRERGEERAAQAFLAGMEAVGWGRRETARRLGVCERLVRDYLSGARQLPAWVPLAMPREGQVAYLQALANGVVSNDSEEPSKCA
ncbi:MAG: hypothetical protein AMXMBFR56_65860 [Polyangiaceae bacterium]